MPTTFKPNGCIASFCDDCGEIFEDTKNEQSIFDTDRCVSCYQLDQILEAASLPVPEEPSAEECAYFMQQAYA